MGKVEGEMYHVCVVSTVTLVIHLVTIEDNFAFSPKKKKEEDNFAYNTNHGPITFV